MIDTPQALDILVERTLTAGCVAIDTEFVWERTYYPQLGVVQLGFSEEDTVLIDAAAFQDLRPLGRLLASPDVVKVLHDAGQDLTILRRVTGASPKNIFDSRLAGGFVGLSATLSLGDLLRELLGVSLSKTEARSNWLRRPLSEAQRAYAHADVRYLPAARDALLAQARHRHREAWLQEEMATYDDPALYEEPDPFQQYVRVSGAGRLTARQRAALRELTAWREEEARRRDLPRGRVVSDKALVDAARRLPESRADLAALRDLDDRVRQRHGAAFLDAVQRGLDTRLEDCPPAPERPPNDEAFTARVHFLLAYLTGKSLAEGIAPTLVATRAEVTHLVATDPDVSPDEHALLRGWRRTFMGDDLLGLLGGQRAIRLDPETGLARLG